MQELNEKQNLLEIKISDDLEFLKRNKSHNTLESQIEMKLRNQNSGNFLTPDSSFY